MMFERREEQSVKYWTEFCNHLQQEGLLRFRLPNPLPSLTARKSPRINFPQGTYILRASQRVRPPVIADAVILTGRDAATYFQALEAQQAKIHSECGEPLSWYAEAASEKRIAFLKWDTDVRDETDWSDQYEWLISKLGKLDEVFRPRIEKLKS